MTPQNRPKNVVKPSFSAKKSLGQNFLTDNLAVDAVVRAIDPKSTDTIVEIGPGHGELTLPLLKSGAKVIAIEKDAQLARELELKTENSKLKIISGDALDVLRNSKLDIRNSNKWKLVGNIPYYITGFLLRTISELRHKPTSIVLTIQKEVAERICAEPRGINPVRGREGSQRPSASNGMNLLSASVQFWGKPEIIKIIPRESFYPVPKVDSAVIKIVPLTSKRAIEQTSYYRFIKILFKQPRKTIFNNLRGVLGEEEIKKAGIDPSLRPQNLSMKEIMLLLSQCSARQNR